ncbi:thiamine permease [Hoyosella sp. YIM 151337]|uniref:purine-cytosine permease family protein n=1 Tax=Hoyosella sp. YIM 151337 TaxID=2992742 RepID=UPI0022354D03|nr:thiamine permease [Hoyosella sp. YIM 151337]MCW4354269.1 thiamine permease [Hoyosella sp. YIM 151337]
MKTSQQLQTLRTSTTDDPRVLAAAATEDYSLHVAPPTWRMHRASLTMAWYSLVSAMFFLYIAASLASAYGTVNALIGLGLAVAVYGSINAVISRFAARTGLTVALFSRAVLGRAGATLATLVFAATAIYYAVFEGSIIGVALHAYFGGNLSLWYLVVVLYSVPLVIGGVRRWLDKLNGVLLPIYWTGLIAAVVWATAANGIPEGLFSNSHAGEVAISAGGPAWLACFSAYMGVFVLMMYTMDFARLARPEDARYHAIVTFGWVYYLLAFGANGVIGIYLVHATGSDSTEGGVAVGIVGLMGLFGVILVWVSQTRINTANYYLASSNLEAFSARALHLHLPRWLWTTIAGAIIYALMLTPVLEYLLVALAWQGALVTGWVAITLVHIALDRRQGIAPESVEFRPGRVRALWSPGLAAWGGSAVTGIAMIESGVPWAATWSSIVTFLLAGGVYAALRTRSGQPSAAIARPHDPRDEVKDPWEVRVECGTCGLSYIAHETDRDVTSADHAPICADCASSHTQFLRAASKQGSPHMV